MSKSSPSDINVQELRTKLGMSQRTFSDTYSIPLRNVQNWEQKRRIPDTTAQTYLQLIEAEPEAIARMLQQP